MLISKLKKKKEKMKKKIRCAQLFAILLALLCVGNARTYSSEIFSRRDAGEMVLYTFTYNTYREYVSLKYLCFLLHQHFLFLSSFHLNYKRNPKYFKYFYCFAPYSH